jgi:hypothetical protein
MIEFLLAAAIGREPSEVDDDRPCATRRERAATFTRTDGRAP